MPDILEEIRRLKEQGRDISNDDLILIQVIEIKNMLTNMDERLEKVEQQQAIQQEYPSLTWLFRYRTRATATAVMALFVLLSLLWISGFRQPILEWLGLPVF